MKPSIPNPAAVATARFEREGWGERHERYCQRAAEGGIDVLILGDSLTQRWETAPEAWAQHLAPRRAAAMGIDGDRTEHLLWRIEDLPTDNLRPRVVVLLIGVNNLGGDPRVSVADTSGGIRAIVKRLRAMFPESRLLLLGLLPYQGRDNWPDPMTPINGVNAFLRTLADGETIHYFEFGHRLLDAQGRIDPAHQPDGCHLSPEGYRIYAEALAPKLDELLANR